MSYEYDYSGFGIDALPANADLTQYVLAPKCIIENPLVDIASVWPKFFWSTHITGPYATGAVSRWFQSMGCDPISLVESAPVGVWPHTYCISDGLDNNGLPLQSSFGLSKDLLFNLDRLTVPEDVDLQQWSNALFNIKAAIQSGNEADLQNWAQSLRLILSGYRHGLCIWPPMQFRNQEHLTAWIAHNLEWRYGWDGIGGKGVFLKGVSAPFAASNPNVNQRALYAAWECADDLLYRAKCGTAISRVWDQTVKYWNPAANNEIFVNGGFVQKPNGTRRRFFDLLLSDSELGSKFVVLHTLVCTQLAYYAEAMGISDAFPGAQYLPHIDTGIGDTVAGFLQSLSSLAVSFMASGGLASGAGLTKVIQGVGQTQISNILKAATDSFKPLANLPLPSHEMWRPVPVHISQFTDGPQCQKYSVPLVPQALPVAVFKPTLAQRALSTISTASLKVPTSTIFKLAESKQPNLLLPALGIGGLLLLMKLLKK